MERNDQIQNWYREYADGIYQYLIYYTGNKDVEDLVQEVFIRAIQSFHTFRGISSPKTWLYSIARHAAMDRAKKKRYKWLQLEFLHTMKSSEKTPEEILHASEEIKDLYDSLKKLKASYREVLILRGIKDFTVSETAEILNWSESKVSLTCYRAIHALKKIHQYKERGE
ncbi:sigma-70 family RNA polymerase sigma factor [Bacillus tianshenii]|uniref:RNA polymerase sigma factor n=1 Tax=Sutcliffiella tianshenii TaxID=1463404 RepID=UPI001CD59B39|nr:sigma-70 family RNA polymerase sigma factor [Bacillus tianshenii]MCA1322233.1 sigma-70 family RNA polymerase sigma factor [Bacillus tianshenii]